MSHVAWILRFNETDLRTRKEDIFVPAGWEISQAPNICIYVYILLIQLLMYEEFMGINRIHRHIQDLKFIFFFWF